jgi:hypothetical protein
MELMGCKMRKLSLLLLFIISTVAIAANRVDPHGLYRWDLYDQDLKEEHEKACLVCHQLSGKRLVVIPTVEKKCLSCHNPSNHSGVKEHIGLKFIQGGKEQGVIGCLTCHRGHRALLKKERMVSYRKFSFVKRPTPPALLEQGLIEKESSFLMLKRGCTDCHQWESLP